MNPVKEFEKYAVKHQGISSNTLNDFNKHIVTNLTPNIIEERPMNVAVMDVYSRLMMDRIIFLGYPLNDEVANIITAQMLFLESTDRQRDGMAASMAAVLMCAGTKGKRTALKHARIMMHQPSGAIGGQASDIEITVNEIRKIKKELYDIISFHTGKPTKQVEKDCDRDFWMTSLESKEYGLVDEVLLTNPRKEKKE